MADRDDEATTGSEADAETSAEPKAKKFKYTPKAKVEAKGTRPEEPAEKPSAQPSETKGRPAPAPAASQRPSESDDDDEPEGEDDEPEDSDDSGEESDDSGGEDDEVDGAADSAEKGSDEDDEEAPAPVKENRAARRKKKKVPEGAEPKDRNERVRKQLLKKKLEAEAEPEALTAGEMVDDAFARGVAATGKWLKKNSVAVQYVLLAALLASVGGGIYTWLSGSKAEAASGLLARAVTSDRGRVDPDPPPKQPGEEEILPIYKTTQDRVEAALGNYKRAASASTGTGAAVLARLGEGGVLLDARRWDDALAAYREVKASGLATADVDVKARTLEGIGFALEGKGDPNAAMGVFKELESLNARGFKELGMYHQARIHAQRGEKERALELVKIARERVKADPRGFAYLDGVLDELGRSIDPALGAKSKGSGKAMGLDQLMNIEDMIKKTQGSGSE